MRLACEICLLASSSSPSRTFLSLTNLMAATRPHPACANSSSANRFTRHDQSSAADRSRSEVAHASRLRNFSRTQPSHRDPDRGTYVINHLLPIEAQARDLHARLRIFAEDWDRPETAIYNEDPARWRPHGFISQYRFAQRQSG